MCIIQTKCGAKGGSTSLTANHSCCEGDSWVENIRWQLYSGTERSSLHDDGVCEQAYERVCDVSGGQRRQRAITTVVGSSRSEGSVCMCDTCDLSALDSAQ